MPAAPGHDSLESLYLLRAEVNRVKRSLRVVGQQVARLIEAAEDTNDSPKEGTRNDEHRTD